MKRTLLFSFLAALALGVGACQKQQTEAERNAEIERQVQQRLHSEANDRKKMARLQAELVTRVNALAAAQKRPAATATPKAAKSASTPTTTFAPDAENGSYSTFYRKLEPYGDWMETGDYGYVFQPRQAAESRDWRPYTTGHWVYTDVGWTWISDEPFGWATYHYGRWIRLRSVGWVWVPGEHWAPAWVSWRRGNDYVGWAPLPPEAQFDRQTGIRNWADNYYDIGPDQYAFVPASEFGRKVSPREIVPIERNVTIINQTTNVTNITYNNSVIVDRGPSYDDLRSRSHQQIERFRLERRQDFHTGVPVFRGDVVALPMMDFHPAESTARPNRVVRTIAQPVVEHGWTGIRDAPAALKARAKMQAEATPPANLPPKRFVRPEQKPSIPSRPVPVKVGRAVNPAVSTASAIPVGTPAPLPSNPPQAPPALPTPAAPLRPNSALAVSPRPSGLQPSVTPPTAAEPKQPSPAENVFSPRKADQTRRDTARAAQEEKRREQEQAQIQAEHQQKMQERRGKKPSGPEISPTAAVQQPAATATRSASKVATSLPVASSTPIASDRKSAAEQHRAKRAERRAKRGESQAETSPDPNHTATPNPQ
jgi:hypothetical protein